MFRRCVGACAFSVVATAAAALSGDGRFQCRRFQSDSERVCLLYIEVHV